MNIYIYILLGLVACSPGGSSKNNVSDEKSIDKETPIDKDKQLTDIQKIDSLLSEVNNQHRFTEGLKKNKIYTYRKKEFDECAFDWDTLHKDMLSYQQEVFYTRYKKDKFELTYNQYEKDIDLLIKKTDSLQGATSQSVVMVRRGYDEIIQSAILDNFFNKAIDKERNNKFFLAIKRYFKNEIKDLNHLKNDSIDNSKLNNIIENLTELKTYLNLSSYHCLKLEYISTVGSIETFDSKKHLCMENNCNALVEIIVPGFKVTHIQLIENNVRVQKALVINKEDHLRKVDGVLTEVQSFEKEFETEKIKKIRQYRKSKEADFKSFIERTRDLLKLLQKYKNNNNEDNRMFSTFTKELNDLKTMKQSLLEITKESLYVFSLHLHGSAKWINELYTNLQEFNIIGDEPHLLKTIQNYFKEKNNKLEKKDFKMTKQQSSIEIVNIWVEDLIDELAQLKNFLFQDSYNCVELNISKEDSIQQYNKNIHFALGYEQSRSFINKQQIEIIIPGFSFKHHQIDDMEGGQKPYVVSHSRMAASNNSITRTLSPEDHLKMIEKYSQRENYKSNRLLKFLIKNKKAESAESIETEFKDCQNAWYNLADFVNRDIILIESKNKSIDFSARYKVHMIELKRLRDLQKSLDSKILDLAVEAFKNK